jgi:acetyltransferase-like isoleucine patch superfamily enzyme
MVRSLRNLLSLIDRRVSTVNSKLYVGYLRRKGVRVGEGTEFFGRKSIDMTRPCLIEIGKKCVITSDVLMLSHGYDWAILREKYGEMLGSSGKVVIEDNVFIGAHTVILKGVRIGRNTIIGAGSVVTHDIPADSVAAGNPCKVVMSISEYYEKRKKVYVEEAKTYALEIYRKTGKVPTKECFWEEFPIFLRRDGDWGELPVKKQLGSAFEKFMKSKPLYKSFEEFLIEAGIPSQEIRNEAKLNKH